jgi:outer membrane protein OmpA-like peptidoglycan-associated protein
LSSSSTRILAVAVSLAVAAGLSGCGSEAPTGEPTGAIAFVVGGRSNMPQPRLDGQALEAFEKAIANQSTASVVVADGEPSNAVRIPLEVKGANEVAREQSRQKNAASLANAVQNATAEDEESDLLAALDLAAREIRSLETVPHTIVVVDSGLSTVAPLDFTQPGLLDAAPQEVAASLKEADALPDLSGTRVILQGLGDTASPQEELSIAQRKNLIAIWIAIIGDAGASDVSVEEKPLQGDPADGLPSVTPVVLSQGIDCTSSTVVLTGGDVAFEPDSAVFRDEAAATALLKPLAEQLVASGATATLTGTTANVGDLEGQKKLSLERASAVRDVLAKLGAPGQNLTAFGLGSEFPGYVQDHTADGSLDPAAAAQNRKVTIDVLGDTSLSCD